MDSNNNDLMDVSVINDRCKKYVKKVTRIEESSQDSEEIMEGVMVSTMGPMNHLVNEVVQLLGIAQSERSEIRAEVGGLRAEVREVRAEVRESMNEINSKLDILLGKK